jgi:hypothetical protein
MNIINHAERYWDCDNLLPCIKLQQISMHNHFLDRNEIDEMISYHEIVKDKTKRSYYIENEAKFLNFFKDILIGNKVVFVSSRKKFLRKRIAIKSTAEYIKKCKNALREFSVNDGVLLIERDMIFVIHYDLSVLHFYHENSNILDIENIAKKNGLYCLDYESLKQEN